MNNFYKSFFAAGMVVLSFVFLEGCSTNPATGESQFAALMSPQQEARVGAEEHQNIMKQYGGTIRDARLQNYVSQVGQRVARNTERADVNYQFFVLDTPMVNAFALPGGYVYVTRGILSLANSEAELASVLAHEIGHVTARHSAERYSHGVVTSLGATILAAALDSQSVAQALGVGSNLYISSYSRKQESQADDLGIRYLHKAGYDTASMSRFLSALDRYSALEAQEAGKKGSNYSYFSTHPQTSDRVAQAAEIAKSYPANQADTGTDAYMNSVDGMIFGDSPEQGFVRGQTFWHPGMAFTFTVPDHFVIANNPTEIIAKEKATGTVVLFDSVRRPGGADARSYLTRAWMKDQPLDGVEQIDINGKPAATGSFRGQINGAEVTIRLVAVEWSANTIFRFQIAIPAGAERRMTESLKSMTYSLRQMTQKEVSSVRPARLRVVTAKAGDSVASLSSGQPYSTLQEQRFRAVNNMGARDEITAGRKYKVITD